MIRYLAIRVLCCFFFGCEPWHNGCLFCGEAVEHQWHGTLTIRTKRALRWVIETLKISR